MAWWGRRRSRASGYGGFGGWAPRPSAHERKASGARAAAALAKKGRALAPVVLPGRRAIASTFWGVAWCENLERYSDYANRLPRGRSYVRSGSVLDLQLERGRVSALVQGSSLYEIAIDIDPVAPARWKAIVAGCAGRIDSLIELLQGKLSDAVMRAMTGPETGLFPSPKNIRMKCSCPDWATMCKHVAAVLYGTGTRLDEAPELLFRLRGADPEDLLATAATAQLARGKGKAIAHATLASADLGSVFGIDIEGASPAPATKPARRLSAAKRAPARTRIETIARAELLRLGVTEATLRRWLTTGLLLATKRRGVYAKTDEARQRIEAYEEYAR